MGAAARCPPAVAITCGSLGLGRWQRLLLLVLWGFLPPNSWCVLLWEREEAEHSPSLLYPVPWRRQSPGVLHFGEGKLRPSPMGTFKGHGFLVCSSKKLILFRPGVFWRILGVGFFLYSFLSQMNLREGPVLCRAFGEGGGRRKEEGGCALTPTSLGWFLHCLYVLLPSRPYSCCWWGCF